MAASATFALKAGVWFRRGRRCMVSPDSQAIACPPSGRNSTYRPVQISGTGSVCRPAKNVRQSLAQADQFDEAEALGIVVDEEIDIAVVARLPARSGGN